MELGCFERQPGDDARGFEYHLTTQGFDLYPVALMFWRFDQLWSEPRLLHPDTLTHGSDEHEMMPVMVCGGCGAEVRSRDVRYQDGPGAGTEESPPPRVSRRSSVTLGSSGARHSTLFGESVDRLGDRWTQMVLAALFLDANRFDEIQRECGIAPNILSLRLKELVDGDLLLRRRYQSGPDRFEYVLTPKGLDMYPIALALMTWGDRWMAADGPPLLLTHSLCGSSLDPAVVCRSCRQVPTPREVAFGSAAA